MRREGLVTRRPSKRLGAWTPADINGLVLWLDNSLITEAGGVVTAWPDLSDEENHFTQASPSIQPNYIASETDFPIAQPAVKFNVANCLLAASSSFLLRWVAVVAVFPGTVFSPFNGLFTTTVAAGGAFALTGDQATANWVVSGAIAGNRYRDGVDTDVALTTANVPHLYVCTFDANQTRTWQVGKDRDVAGRQWGDSVCLVLGGTSPLSVDDIANLTTYSQGRGMIP